MAFGFEAKQVKPLLTDVGNTASALGQGTEGIDRITYALGQMKAATRVQLGELNQLTEMGIPAYEILAQAVGKPVPVARQLASEGKIASDVFQRGF